MRQVGYTLLIVRQVTGLPQSGYSASTSVLGGPVGPGLQPLTRPLEIRNPSMVPCTPCCREAAAPAALDLFAFQDILAHPISWQISNQIRTCGNYSEDLSGATCTC